MAAGCSSRVGTCIAWMIKHNHHCSPSILARAHSHVSSRNLAKLQAPTIENLQKSYAVKKVAAKNEKHVKEKLIDSQAVFANNELSLKDVDVYGFDYDYTLAKYTEEMDYLIYETATKNMIQQYGYPVELMKLEYDPKFAVRGLHFDITKGLLMKIDSYHNIMPGTVYRGLRCLDNEEVTSIYGGSRHVPIDILLGGKMKHMIDLFSLPEMMLLANVIEYFIQNGIPYDPEYLHRDCNKCIQMVHNSGQLHQAVTSNIERYLQPNKHLTSLLNRLLNSGKQLFLITNSAFKFVDCGMTQVVGPDWMDIFDVVITEARKPSFYNQTYRPFRSVDPHFGTPTWHVVSHFEKGQVYREGNMEQFIRFTEWFGPRVLYFGDHVYSDLRDPVLKHGWRAGAIIRELEREIDLINSVEYKERLNWLIELQTLINQLQIHDTEEANIILKQWKNERNAISGSLKAVMNPRFGSVFRTFTNPTYFCRRLMRFADIYTSSVENLLRYKTNYTFYPPRTFLPHEQVLRPL